MSKLGNCTAWWSLQLILPFVFQFFFSRLVDLFLGTSVVFVVCVLSPAYLPLLDTTHVSLTSTTVYTSNSMFSYWHIQLPTAYSNVKNNFNIYDTVEFIHLNYTRIAINITVADNLLDTNILQGQLTVLRRPALLRPWCWSAAPACQIASSTAHLRAFGKNFEHSKGVGTRENVPVFSTFVFQMELY